MFGKTDKGLAELGFGGMFGHGKSIEQVELEDLKFMVDSFIDAGFSYFDNAFAYDAEEPSLEKALFTRHSRDSYRVAQKITPWKMQSPEDMKRNFEYSLRTTSVDYYDFLMLHNVSRQGSRATKFERFDAWDFVLRQKQRGLAKHVGISFHDKADMLEDYLREHPGIEFVMLQINYMDWDNHLIQARENCEVARKHGLPVMVMKPLRGGVLTKLPPKVMAISAEAGVDPASLALRFCASIPEVGVVCSTMNTREDLERNLAIMGEQGPLSEDEYALIDEMIQELRNVDLIQCSNCGYCVDVCPRGVRIPWILQAMDDYSLYHQPIARRSYLWETNFGGKASECIGCKRCLSQCALGISIVDHMAQAVELFERAEGDTPRWT